LIYYLSKFLTIVFKADLKTGLLAGVGSLGVGSLGVGSWGATKKVSCKDSNILSALYALTIVLI